MQDVRNLPTTYTYKGKIRVVVDSSAEVSCDVFSELELHGCIYRVGKSRVTVVCIENDTINNNPGVHARVSCSRACKPDFASTPCTAQNK